MLRLHAAADGHLLRIRLPGGHLSVAALEAIGDLSRFGNGLIELTSRASIQVRGLASNDAEPAAGRLTAAGLLPSALHDRVRNILAAPLGGRSLAALLGTDALVEEIDRGLCADSALAALPGRFLFAVEDGSGVLGGSQGDVTLVAEPGTGTGVRLRLHLASRPTTRTAAPEASAPLALDAARAFLAVSASVLEAGAGAIWRIADLPSSDFDRLLERLETRFISGPRLESGRQLAPGVERQADGNHAVTALAPLGRLQPDAVRGLAAIAADSGGRLRVSPWRTISVIDVPHPRLESVVEGLSALGLVLDEASGWRNLSACAGLGACVNARIDVRAAAAQRAGVRGAAATAGAEHWSACERRCGRPARFAHAVTATAEGVEVASRTATRRLASVEEALALLDSAHAAPSTNDGEVAPPAPAEHPVAVAAGGSRP